MSKVLSRAAPSASEALRVNVIVARAKARFSQDELAKRASVSRQTISRIERAASDVGIEVVSRIADALGTTISELLVPFGPDHVDDDELARRAAAPREESIDARALLAAIDQAAGRPTELERFSRAGRPPVHRGGPTTSR